jgi:ubiquinone/menaquinone biosynthesis C-methylase UbiE
MKRLVITTFWLASLGLFGAAPLQRREASAQPPAHHSQHHEASSVEDVDRWIHLFESPDREAWQRPGQVVSALLLTPGQKVADIGAGSGYFSRRFAREVGGEGTVWAVDIEPGMLRYIQKTARQEGLRNVVTILAAADDPMLPPGQSDLIFICNTLHHIQDRVRYLGLLRQLMSPTGRLVVVDYFKEELPVGPPSALKLSREAVIAEASAAGFNLKTEHLFLPYQYFLVFGK